MISYGCSLLGRFFNLAIHNAWGANQNNTWYETASWNYQDLKFGTHGLRMRFFKAAIYMEPPTEAASAIFINSCISAIVALMAFATKVRSNIPNSSSSPSSLRNSWRRFAWIALSTKSFGSTKCTLTIGFGDPSASNQVVFQNVHLNCFA